MHTGHTDLVFLIGSFSDISSLHYLVKYLKSCVYIIRASVEYDARSDCLLKLARDTDVVAD